MAYQSTRVSEPRQSVVAAVWSAVQQAFVGERSRRGRDIATLSDHLRRDLGFEPTGAAVDFSGLSHLRG